MAQGIVCDVYGTARGAEHYHVVLLRGGANERLTELPLIDSHEGDLCPRGLERAKRLMARYFMAPRKRHRNGNE